MTRSPRLLVVSPIASHPANQGNSARLQVLAQELMDRCCELELFYYGMEGLSDRQRSEMSAFWADFHFMPSLPNPRPTFAHCMGIDDWCPQALCDAVHRLHQQRCYDAVLVNYVWMSRVLEGLLNTYRIIDTHDLFGGRHQISIDAGLDPRWFFTTIEEENRGFQRADLVLGIQDQESQAIRQRVSVETITVGHAMIPYFLTSFEGRQPLATFGYLGSGNPWNVRCILELDGVLAETAGADWLLAGSMLKRELEFKSGPYLLGVVDRLQDFYHAVDCVVNPMIGGTGLKIKTVEALAYGKSVIGTVDAFVGLPTKHPAHALDGVASCVGAMEQYRLDPSFRDGVRIASRSLYFEYVMQVNEQLDRLTNEIRHRTR